MLQSGADAGRGPSPARRPAHIAFACRQESRKRSRWLPPKTASCFPVESPARVDHRRALLRPRLDGPGGLVHPHGGPRPDPPRAGAYLAQWGFVLSAHGNGVVVGRHRPPQDIGMVDRSHVGRRRFDRHRIRVPYRPGHRPRFGRTFPWRRLASGPHGSKPSGTFPAGWRRHDVRTAEASPPGLGGNPRVDYPR
jgi:hypothetical protein